MFRPALAADTAKKDQSILDRLYANTGVYHKAPGANTPDFVSDPGWPAPLPHNWLLGQIGGLYVDHHDHIWIYNRPPRTMTTDEAALDTRGGSDGKNGLGFARPNGAVADCCNAAPSVLEFDTSGKLLRAWGGPADPGWLESHCKAADGCIWPNSEHGIYVDANDNVWLAGNGVKPVDPNSSWTTHKEGGDGFVLKFDMDGNFKMRIGGTPSAPDSNNKDGGINGTPLLYLPADMVVDSGKLYVADGYGNRRVLIVDANTGKYIGHFGAYGQNPVDDAAAAAGGRWVVDRLKGVKKPAFFRNPVHCVKIADDGKIYVCDRGNDRIQVFDKNDPDLDQPCSSRAARPASAVSSPNSGSAAIPKPFPAMPGTSVSLNCSRTRRAELSLCRRQFQHDDLSAQSQQSRGAGKAGSLGPRCRPVPLAAPGEPGQPWQHLYGGSRYRKAHPEIRALRRSGVQRHRIDDSRQHDRGSVIG